MDSGKKRFDPRSIDEKAILDIVARKGTIRPDSPATSVSPKPEDTAEEIAGIPSSWPGYDLTIGASGQKVRQLQEQLDAIATVYTAIVRSVRTVVVAERHTIDNP